MDEKNYFINDEESSLIASMTDDELMRYIECLEIEVEEEEKGNKHE